MPFTHSELRARHSYVERSLQVTLDMLRRPEVAGPMGRLACDFTDMLSMTVVANMTDGMVELPAKYRDDPDVLPVVAVRPGEPVCLGTEFHCQTSRQKANTLGRFRAWQPTDASVDELYKDVMGGEQQTVPVIVMPDLTRASTYMYARFIASDNLQGAFAKAPTKGFGLVNLRPCVLFKMHGTNTYAQPDEAIHELVHVDQMQRTPVNVVHSQKSLDMLELRRELEAYHIGSFATICRLRQRKKQITEDELSADPGIIQLAVEITRSEHYREGLDPYMPSPALLKKLAAKGLDHIMHARLSYDALEAQLQKVLAMQVAEDQTLF